MAAELGKLGTLQRHTHRGRSTLGRIGVGASGSGRIRSSISLGRRSPAHELPFADLIASLCKDPGLMCASERIAKALREPLPKVFAPALTDPIREGVPS